ncbi:hypothetical protein KIN20_006582 [Parelaphostrongylus tenuis]|uniref:Uncharacterized protein n=1 Tax=Parelaphostrongylus tenuis TaxID=148309 RepID=A0AAD5MMS7_PARTN|nr:hypothetical protein KIN20_006582 [Parelaphostrongylus tenuis]
MDERINSDRVGSGRVDWSAECRPRGGNGRWPMVISRCVSGGLQLSPDRRRPTASTVVVVANRSAAGPRQPPSRLARRHRMDLAPGAAAGVQLPLCCAGCRERAKFVSNCEFKKMGCKGAEAFCNLNNAFVPRAAEVRQLNGGSRSFVKKMHFNDA